MFNKTIQSEVKVGIFVTTGVSLIMLSLLLLGGTDGLMTRQVRYHTHVQAADGLIPGAKVVLNGLQVGVVEAVDFDFKLKLIDVVLKVQKKYEGWVREDSTAEITTQGVLGDKFVALTSSGESSPPLKEHGVITAKVGQSLSQFISKGDQLVVHLTSIAASLDRILKTIESGNRSENLVQSIVHTSKNLSEVSLKLNQELDHIQIKSTVKNLNGILEKINNGTGTLGALINDPNLYYDARSLLGGANRNRIMRNLIRKTMQDNEEKSTDTDTLSAPSTQ